MKYSHCIRQLCRVTNDPRISAADVDFWIVSCWKLRFVWLAVCPSLRLRRRAEKSNQMLGEVMERTWPPYALQAGTGQLEAPHPSSVLGMYSLSPVPTLEAVPKRTWAALGEHVWLTSSAWCMWLNPVKPSLWTLFSFFLKKFIYFYFWLHWVFVAACGLSLVAVRGGYSLLQCTGFSLPWLLLLQSMGSRCTGFSSCGSQVLERRLSSCGTRA